METTKKRGFASLTPEQRKEFATRGGKTTSSNRAHMSEIGRKGGTASAAKKRPKKLSVDMGAGPTDNL